METILPGLHASASIPLSFAPGSTIRAFLLQRGSGNILLYASDAVADDAAAVEELGGISRHYLNHWHEAGMGCGRIAETFGAPLVCHRLEEAHVAETCPVSDTFSDRHQVADDLEAIPIPGHTQGATAYLWDNGHGDRCLFTGDTVFLGDEGWRAAVLNPATARPISQA